MNYRLSRAEQLEQTFCDMLDEAGAVVIAGISFDPSRILQEMDPIAYDTELANFMDAEGYDLDEDEYDGQPDEAQEWYDFDPDC